MMGAGKLGVDDAFGIQLEQVEGARGARALNHYFKEGINGRDP